MAHKLSNAAEGPLRRKPRDFWIFAPAVPRALGPLRVKNAKEAAIVNGRFGSEAAIGGSY